MRKTLFQRTIVKWIGFLAVFVSAVVVSISVSLYHWYADDNVKLYSEMTVKMLRNTSQSIEILDQSIVNSGFLTVNDHEIASAMNNTTVNYNIYGPVQEKLIHYIFTNPLVSSIYLVNPQANLIIGSPSPGTLNPQAYNRMIRPLLEEQKEQSIIRLDTYEPDAEGLKDAGEATISYVFFQTRQSAENDSFLIINVKEADMAERMADINAMPGIDIFAVNRKGTVVFARDTGQLYRNFNENPDVQSKLMDNPNSNGFFVHDINGIASLVSYIHSEEMKLRFVSVTPYSVVRQAAQSLKLRTIELSAMILLLGLAAAIVIARHFHLPLRRLIRKYFNESDHAMSQKAYRNEFEMLDGLIEAHHHKAASLDQFVNEHLPIIKQDFLIGVLEGRIPIDHELADSRLREIGTDFEGDRYRIVLLQPGEGRYEASFVRLAKDALSSVQACEALPGMSERFLVVLLNFTSGEPELPLHPALLSLMDRVKSVYRRPLTVVIGPEGGMEQLNMIYKRTVELQSYVVKYGFGAVIDEAGVARDIAGENLFPSAEERQLMIGLRSLSGDHCTASIRAMVQQMYGYSMHDILRTINHVLYSTLQTIKEMIQSKDVPSEFDTFQAYEKLMNYNTLQEFEANLVAFYGQIIADFGKGDEGRHHTIRKVLDYIHQHYGDSAISLDSVAAGVNLNPSYLGKLFKESEGIHFTEYVNQLRMNRAQQLLKDTSDSLTKISLEVGFNSTSYFVTCFKKYTGMTPTKFRSSQ